MDGRDLLKSCQKGFSLLELLFVITILAIIGSIVTININPMHLQAKGEAEKLASLLRSARQFAVENSVHTRVVFADKILDETTGGKLPHLRAYGAYALYTPSLPDGGSDYKPFAGEGGLTPEFASMTFTAIPSGFVGQFRPLPNYESWRLLNARIEMVGYVPEDAELEPDYSRDFFDPSNPLSEMENAQAEGEQPRYVSRYFYNPEHFWDPNGRAYYLANVPNATYPRNYHQTPYPTSYPLRSTRSMPDEPSDAEFDGKALHYNEVWGERAELRYFHEIEEYKGSYDQLGQPDSSDSEDQRFFNLRGIEFSPTGLPTLDFAEKVAFFFYNRNHSEGVVGGYEVTIDSQTGLAHIKKARRLVETDL